MRPHLIAAHEAFAALARPRYGRPMILIGQYDSPFVRRVAIALKHYGLAYKHQPWSVWRDEAKVAEYSPLRRVPILVLDDGETLIESAAILDALDDMVGAERALAPRTGPNRRQVLRICALATGLADKAVSLFYEHFLRKEEARSDVWLARCAGQLNATLDLLEQERAKSGGEYWFGALSHADIAVACALRFVSEAEPSLDAVAARPALAAHAAQCEALPLFASVVQPFYVAR